MSFPVTVNSTFRLSYGHNVQVPPITELFRSQNTDFQGGSANTNTEFGRDIKLPRTVQFEAGYRQLFGTGLVMDIVAYSKTVRNGLTYRILAYDNPKIPGQQIRVNSLTNADYSLTRGLEVTFDQPFVTDREYSPQLLVRGRQGHGSDPLTYIDLISRSNNNVALLNNGLVDPPEVMLPLDQSRTHNFASTVQLTLPRDYNPVFADVGVFATIRVSSGLPYTRILNIGGGGTAPPSASGGTPAEPINSSQLPWDKRIDLRSRRA